MGYDVFVGFGDEAAWGTPVARTEFHRSYEDSRLQHEKPQNPYEYLGDRDAQTPFFQAERGAGNVVIPLVYDGMQLLMKHCMGVKVDAGAGPYTHTYTLDNAPFTRTASPLVGLTTELHYALPDSSLESFLLYGGRVRSFGSNFRVNEETKLNVDMVGQRVVQAQKSAAPTFPDYASAGVSPLVKFTQIAVTIDGAGSQVIYGLEWSCNNNLRDDKVELGGQYISAPRAQGKREITGTLEKEWLSKAHYDKFIAGSTAAIIATGTGPGNMAIEVRFPNVFYTGETPSLQEAEEQDQSLPFTAYDDATHGAMKITLTNDSAT